MQSAEVPNDHAILGDRNAYAFAFMISSHKRGVLGRTLWNRRDLGGTKMSYA